MISFNQLNTIRYKMLGSLLMFFCLGQNAFSQEYDFRVMVSKGNNRLIIADSQESKDLEAGDLVQVGDEVIASEDGYIGFVHRNGQTLELMEPGRYLVNDLIAEISGQKNLATRSLNFLWDKVYESLLETKNNTAKNLDLNLELSGLNNGKIQVLAVNHQKLNPVFGDKAEIRWIGGDTSSDDQYVVNLMNLYDQVLFSEMVSQPEFTLKLSDERLLKNEIFSSTKILCLIVYSANNMETSSWRYGITPIKKSDHEVVTAEVQFYKDVLAPMSKVDRLVIAQYYEEKGLLLDALTVYEGLVREAPELNDFQLLYNAFIKRNLEKTIGREL